MLEATLRLFHAVQIDIHHPQTHSDHTLEHTLQYGYVLSSSVPADEALLVTIDREIGLSGEQANTAFHKSWKTIKETPRGMLFIQQMIHYLTTYGLQDHEVKQSKVVYIPHETLTLPEVQEDIPLTLIHALTADELLLKIIQLGSGAALANSTLDDIMLIVKENQYDVSLLSQIDNRELKIRLYDHYDRVPTDPMEYLRYVLIKLTGQSLLIKSNALIQAIKMADNTQLDALLTHAPDDLASLFLRFKPLFLAMKSISSNKHFFNRLRKQAKYMHQPLPEDYMNSVTRRIKHNELDLTELTNKLSSASVFRKIRLLYALLYRLISSDSIVYRIRNGKGWATDFVWNEHQNAQLRAAYERVWNSLVEQMKRRVKDKTFYIPQHVHYAIPATEKQFTGFFPTGSWVSIPHDLVVGIHWVDTPHREVDLDLSLIGLSGKIGWDGDYKSQDGTILFSGDMTEAPLPNGAAELFYIQKGVSEPKILAVNYYNYCPVPVQGKIVVGSQTQEEFVYDYLYNMNKLLCSANIEITEHQNILGLIVNQGGTNQIYFANINVGSSITSSVNNHSMHARRYLLMKAIHSLEFADLLTSAEATVVHEKPQSEYVDLSPEMLTKTTFLSWLQV